MGLNFVGNELAKITEYAHSDKEAIARAKKQLRIINAAYYEAVSIAGKTLRLLRAPKTAKATEKVMTRAKQFVDEIVAETQKGIRKIERLQESSKLGVPHGVQIDLPKKHKTPPLPP